VTDQPLPAQSTLTKATGAASLAAIQTEQIAAFHRMRAIATGLVALMAVVFVVSKVYEDSHLAIGFIRAFSEAALVGALADWFAVTALFRHPLGLPIPHTAIVPKSKDRIGSGLGRFISRNFLQPEQVSRRLEPIDLTGHLADWLADGDRARKVAGAVAGSIPRLLSVVNDGRIAGWLQSMAVERIKKTDVATLLADGIELLTRNNRHAPIVDLILFHADLAVHSQEGEFRRRVSDRTDWLPKLLAIDQAASDALLDAIKDTLKAAAADKDHSLRSRIDDALAHFARDLRLNPNLRDQLANWMREMSGHPSVARYVSQIWDDVKRGLSNPDAIDRDRLVTIIASGLNDAAAALQNDGELRDSLNQRIKVWAVELAETQGHAVGDIVADTIRNWDAKTVVSQIENAVGRDLQYIRINGTVIGGLVGLIIHTIVYFFF
jgi:uncharacterized membrane-anchored protein YjiN (DUF445 family)